MSKKALLTLVLAFAALIIGASFLYQSLADQNPAQQQLATMPVQTTAPNATEGETAPDTTGEAEVVIPAIDFTVYDAEGNAVKLSDFYGKPIVLNFWASWCGPCRSEMPDFQKACTDLEGQVQFLMINMTDGSRETLDTAKAFLSDSGYTFPVFFDTDVDAAIKYSVYALPTTFFINAEGHLVAYAESALSEDLLQKGIDMITGSPVTE